LKVKFYDGVEIDLKKCKDYNEIEDLLEKEFFSVKDYQGFYGVNSKEVLSSDLWGGVRVNQVKSLHFTQGILNHIAGLINTFQRVAVKQDIYDFARLRAKQKENWTTKEKEKYQELKSRLYFLDRQMILIRVPEYENAKTNIILKKIRNYKNQIKEKEEYIKHFNSVLRECSVPQFKNTVSFINNFKYEIIILKEKIYNLIDLYYEKAQNNRP